jgi:hypothetical protein
MPRAGSWDGASRSLTMLNHNHERRYYGIQKLEAAGRGSPSAGQASDGDPVPRIARGSGTDCEGVLGRLRRATKATFADHRVPLQRFSQVEGEEGRRRTTDCEEPSRGSSAGVIGREAQCGNCWTSEAAGNRAWRSRRCTSRPLACCWRSISWRESCRALPDASQD